MNKILSFDVEISDLFDLKKDEDMKKYAPFHISTAATAVHKGEERLFFSKNDDGETELNLTKKNAYNLLEYLDEKQRDGDMVCAWNGLGFDLRWIGFQAEDIPFAAQIALKSYDPMFQFFNLTGFPVSLANTAKGMGIRQTKSMNGADAPKEWCNGNHQKVMDYCLGDCQMTNLVIRAIQKRHGLSWITAKGTASSRPMPRLETVETVIHLPGPDQSWMNDPIQKTSFYDWIPKD